MADFQQQLRSILGDPEAMSRIAALARTLNGPGSGQAPEDGPAAGTGEQTDFDFVPAGGAEEDQSGSPADTPGETAAVPDLSSLLSALGGGGGTGPDPRLLQIAGEAIAAYSAEDSEKEALLSALKPFLSPRRQEKLEQAERITRLLRAARTALRLWQEEQHV